MERNTREKKNNRYRENFLKKKFNQLLAGGLIFISRFPFWLLYLISDLLRFFIRKIFRYRRPVIFDNLRHAFPEKTDKEIKSIARKFYRHFTDLLLESIKLYSISAAEMDRRITFKGLDLVKDLYREGKSVIILAMHHNNWEWCSFVQTKVDYQGLMIYNPIRGNQAMERFLLHSREKWGGRCIPVNKSARTAMDFHRRGIPSALWLGADQAPRATSKFWTLFLNREAPFFSGPEKIAVKTNQPVFLERVRKTGRGHYEAEFIPLFMNPQEVEPQEILLAYIHKMEAIIRKEPAYYLWSHRRWKHQRPENIPLTLNR